MEFIKLEKMEIGKSFFLLLKYCICNCCFLSVELEQREGYTHAMNLVLTKMNQRRLEEIEQETENIVPVRKTKTRILRTTTIQKSSTKRPKSVTGKLLLSNSLFESNTL